MIYKTALSAMVLLVASQSYAGKALWTFEALSPTTVSLPKNSTVTVQYQVTNQSSKTHVLAMKTVTGITQTTTGIGRCSSPFTLEGGASCLLELEINGSELVSDVTSGPEVYDTGSTLQGYQPSAAASLKVTVENALPVASLQVLNPALDLFVAGRPSTLTIKNTSTNLAAHNLFLNFEGTPLQGQVKTVSNTCDDVPAQSYCRIRLIPENSARRLSIELGAAAATATLESEDKDSTTQPVNISVYKVGESYGGGIIACVSETDDFLNFIVTSTDVGLGERWGGYRKITSANSDADGATNTKKIVEVVGNNDGTNYAAKVCNDSPIGGYYDWFLLAKKQLNCVYLNKAHLGTFVTGRYYWSSTESVDTSKDDFYAWAQYFNYDQQIEDLKTAYNLIRCGRPIPSS